MVQAYINICFQTQICCNCCKSIIKDFRYLQYLKSNAWGSPLSSILNISIFTYGIYGKIQYITSRLSKNSTPETQNCFCVSYTIFDLSFFSHLDLVLRLKVSLRPTLLLLHKKSKTSNAEVATAFWHICITVYTKTMKKHPFIDQK